MKRTFKAILKGIGSLLTIFDVPKGVYEYRTADVDAESIKKDWEAILGPAENWKINDNNTKR